MKRVLATTTILALSTGFAAAEITMTGDARMGIISDYGSSDVEFTSRARVTFNLSGESDSGFSFGASFRADNAGSAASGEAGSVWIEGAFGKLSMGDVDHADLAAVGHVSGVGLTGLDDQNELWFDSESGNITPHILYGYTSGAFSGYASYDTNDTYAFGAKYATDAYSVAAGYARDGSDGDRQLSLAGSATFGAVTAKARYMTWESDWFFDQYGYALSLDYVADALTVTGYYTTIEIDTVGTDEEVYGLGATYDLGGGASIVGGYVNDVRFDTSAWDLGLSFSF